MEQETSAKALQISHWKMTAGIFIVHARPESHKAVPLAQGLKCHRVQKMGLNTVIKRNASAGKLS